MCEGMTVIYNIIIMPNVSMSNNFLHGKLVIFKYPKTDYKMPLCNPCYYKEQKNAYNCGKS